MAEAVVESPRNRFYCHQCSREITPHLPDYTCPRCDSGFIEELTEDFEDEQQQQEESADGDPAVHFAEMWGRTFLDSFRMHAHENPGSEEGSPEGATATRPTRQQHHHHHHHPGIRVSINRRQPHGQGPPRNHALEAIIHQLIGGLTGQQGFARGPGLPGVFSMYGNPGDYAWGVGGLDSIITQLMNQLEGAGAPPAPQDQIDALPTVTITQEQVDKTLQCSVCMEYYKFDEEVKKLPCDHYYHNDCIIPWLTQHGTCPVCRKTLDGKVYTDEVPFGMPPDSPESSHQPMP